MKILIELLQQDEEKLKRVNHEDGKEEKMADSVDNFGDMINITKERKEILIKLIKEGRGCARLNLEVNCTTLELESATEIAKNLKESENVEGRNTKSARPSNDYTYK
jgi:hypothetical protein